MKDTVAPWQHVTLYGLSIGAEGNRYPTGFDASPGGTPGLAEPTGGTPATPIDDLWHAAINSSRQVLQCQIAQELAESIVSCLADFTAQSGTGTGVGIAGAQLTATKAFGYRTSYGAGWSGDVKKYALTQHRRFAR